MWSTLEPGSSPVDWCEENYTFSPMIAEFVNTISNVLFFILPPVLMHLFRGYGQIINPAIHVIWVLLIVVGLSSAYFHATLSLVGQLLDELAILWVFFAAFSMFFPRRLFPTFLHNDRKLFSLGAVFLAMIGTVLAIIQPAVNAFALMTLGIPSVILLIHEVRRANNERIHRLGIRCASAWCIAVFCWVNDRLLCEAWSSIQFPYLHGLWHIFIFIASYTACVLFAYFAVREERPEKRAVLRYWPRNDFELGIPYVLIKTRPDDDIL
ncbi:alkaline ceramidase [Atheta coriaria]|uniref:alkaline ceramidase n=1 Tax=Dalotia coriaria TaxID=877792 RepID=UPI0031F3AB35